MDLLTLLNVGLTLISVVGILYILQEKFTTSPAIKAVSPSRYYLLRGSLAALAAAQLSTLYGDVAISSLLTNGSLAVTTYIVSKQFH